MEKDVFVSKKELDWAQEAIDGMLSASNIDRYEKNWVDFLHYLDRAWNKMQKACSGKSQQLKSETNRLRNKDELLQYLMQARNSDEHTIKNITMRITSYVTVTGGAGGGKIVRGVINGDGNQTGLVLEGDIEVEFHPETIEVIAVTNYDATYSVPSKHLGIDIKTLMPHELAAMGLNYYREISELITK